MSADQRESRYILGGRVDVTDYGDAEQRISDWAGAGESRYCCFCTVHMIMEAHDSPEFQSILNAADFVHPDGMPLVWVQRLLGAGRAHRVTGHDLMFPLLERASREKVPVGFYGSSPQTIERLVTNLTSRYPDLNVAYAFSPPFRPLTPEEDAQIVEEIRRSGVRILFVGLGCPKQERWMNAHRDRVPCVMLGVGAIFDTYAGNAKRAPVWLQNLGLEWLHRLLSEPRRLWKRYLSTNPRFLFLVVLQLLRVRRYQPAPPAPTP